ncbi:uncharacterized protein LOC119090448 [Pollicipes pollicipes]|uniref:uncharacterized protein LOC119090448 n=1 Tax=Pollicipes pollicipes TaxID=41117 RepID=UPI00188521B0|nr:uncharacterized protein LOC119090448 [Pollicipes pollicipes]
MNPIQNGPTEKNYDYLIETVSPETANNGAGHLSPSGSGVTEKNYDYLIETIAPEPANNRAEYTGHDEGETAEKNYDYLIETMPPETSDVYDINTMPMKHEVPQISQPAAFDGSSEASQPSDATTGSPPSWPTLDSSSPAAASGLASAGVESNFDDIRQLQAPLRNLVINKLGVKFASLSQLFRRPNLTNPYPDFFSIIRESLARVRVDALDSVAKRDVDEDHHTLQLLVHGIRVDVDVPSEPAFHQAGPTLVTQLAVDKIHMYATLLMHFSNVSVPLNFSVNADLFPPYFSIRHVRGSALVSIGSVLVPIRVPYNLYFQKSSEEPGKAAVGVLMPEDFVTHGISMLNVSTEILGCRHLGFLEKEVIRFEEQMKNSLELWLSEEPLTSLVVQLRHHLLGSTKKPATMSLGHITAGSPNDRRR